MGTVTELNRSLLPGLRHAVNMLGQSISTYDNDPPHDQYQEGHKAALENARVELEREITKLGGGH